MLYTLMSTIYHINARCCA